MRLSPGQISQAQRSSPKQRPSDRRSVGRKPGAASAGRLEPCALAVDGSGSSPVRLLAKRCPASRRTEAFALPIGGIDAIWLKARAFDALQKRYFGHHWKGNKCGLRNTEHGLRNGQSGIRKPEAVKPSSLCCNSWESCFFARILVLVLVLEDEP